MKQQPELNDIYKIILVGDAGTGKTNIIYSFTKEKIPNNIMPTVALEYTSKIVELDDQRRVKAQIWDTAGQEQYRALTMKHYQKAVGAFIVFDVANRRSFEHVNEWVSAIIDKADSSVQMGLLGHKSDHLRREVSHEEAEALGAKLNCFYLQTTVKNPRTIKDAFKKLLTNVTVIKISEVTGIKLNERELHRHAQESSCSC